MSDFNLPRRLTAEALGTALLVATVVGSGIMAESLTRDVALALLGNTLPTGAILVVLITILGPISGAHFNPAVTLIFALKRELTPREAVSYMAAQVAGGIAGTMLAHAMFDAAAARCLAQGADRQRAMAGRGRRRLRPGRDHSRRDQVQHAGRPLAGRALYYGGLLVYRVDLVCQSGRRHRTVADQHVFRHSPESIFPASSPPSFAARWSGWY